MITSLIMFAFLSIYVGILSLFPSAETFPWFTDMTDFLTEHLSSVAALFPVDYFLVAIAFVIAFELRFLIVKLVMLIVGFVRGGH